MQPGPENFDFELPGLSEMPPPELGGIQYGDEQQPAAPPAAPDPVKLAAEMEELRKKLETTEARLNDTQRWGQQQNAGREMAQHLMELRAAEQAEAQRQAQAAAAFALPTLSDEDREALGAIDPDVFNRHVEAVAGAMANRVYASVMPRVQAAEAFSQVAGPLIDMQAERVAEMVAQGENLSKEDAAALMPEARNALYAAAKNDPMAYARYCLNPETVKWALRMAMDNMPQGTRPSPRGPSLGGGDPSASRGGRGIQTAPAPSMAAMQISRALGVQFTKEDLAEVQQKVRNQRR